MRIDVVTIFPTFFDVLEVSLLGKAREKGLLDVRVHDLRDATTEGGITESRLALQQHQLCAIGESRHTGAVVLKLKAWQRDVPEVEPVKILVAVEGVEIDKAADHGYAALSE